MDHFPREFSYLPSSLRSSTGPVSSTDVRGPVAKKDLVDMYERVNKRLLDIGAGNRAIKRVSLEIPTVFRPTGPWPIEFHTLKHT